MNDSPMPFLRRPSSLAPLLLAAVLGVVMPVSPLASEAQAQDSEPTRNQKAMHYSLYYESFKNDQYADARSDLLWIIDNAPGFPRGDDRNFERQVELYEGLAENASSDDARRAYLDTAATHLSTATQRMDEQGIEYDAYAWEIRKGRFAQEHAEMLPKLSADSLQDPETHYRNAFEMAPEEVDPYYLQQTARAYLQENRQEEALAFADKLEAERGDDEDVQTVISSIRDDIFGKNPQAKINYLQKQLKANPDSAGVMLSLFNAYVRQGNISKASELAPRLMETNPPAETVREIAEMRLENGRAKAALKAYQQAEEQGAELQPQDYLNRGDAHQQMGNFSRARREYRKALDMKPDYGRAYLAIGDLYASAVNECSGGQLGRKDKAVYWAAVDKYQQAVEADSTLKSIAQSKMQSYRDVFPTQEDIFYREDWSEGGQFTINYGCYSWINETTTVRQAP
jgi:tetratricopeptide (TPR) repeat protein